MEHRYIEETNKICSEIHPGQVETFFERLFAIYHPSCVPFIYVIVAVSYFQSDFNIFLSIDKAAHRRLLY